MNLLQHIPTLPRGGDSARELYVRSRSGIESYDTYFGAFAASYWRSLTTVRSVVLEGSIQGNGQIELVALRNGSEHILQKINAGDGRFTAAPVDIVAADADALFMRLSGCSLREAQWRTPDIPTREVRIEGVITTFNRPEYVQRNLHAFSELTESTPEIADSFRLCVVDNAQNLSIDTSLQVPIQVIPNPNLGGAGGFTRGLMEVRRAHWATHVLFMDDDITIEPESLVRTISFLRYASDSMTCVHGAMISEDQPWLCIEAGADYVWRSIYPPRPLHHLEDLRDRSMALAAKLDRPYAYSAWWYTAFPISLTNDNPLPVFIRGDDVAWGLMHTRGHIQTLPGVAVWHADFDIKNVPAAVYYEIRNITLASLLTVPNYRWWHFLKRFLGYAFLNLYSMRYLSTEYLLRGTDDFFKGPDAWMQLDHEALHQDLYSRNEEKSTELSADLAAVEMDSASTQATSMRDFVISLLTFGGNLIPARMRLKSPTAVPVQKRAIGASIRHDFVVHRHPRLNVGFISKRDQKRFWILLLKVGLAAIKIPLLYGLTAKRYRAAYPRMTSDAAWERSFTKS